VLCIHPRQIFEDVYVPMRLVDESHLIGLGTAARIRRKGPQSDRTRRASAVRIGMM
jgi:hypothetical protein